MLLLASGGKDTNCTDFSFLRRTLLITKNVSALGIMRVTFLFQMLNYFQLSCWEPLIIQGTLLLVRTTSVGRCYGIGITWLSKLFYHSFILFVKKKKDALVNYRKKLLKCHLENKEGWMSAVPEAPALLCFALLPWSTTCSELCLPVSSHLQTPKCCQGTFRPLRIIFISLSSLFLTDVLFISLLTLGRISQLLFPGFFTSCSQIVSRP